MSALVGLMVAVAAPPAPSWDILVTDWSLDLAFPVVLALAAAYIVGVRRLQTRGRSWPASRTAAFLSGLAVILIATESGLAAYDRVLFSLHIVQHVLLGMVAALLLVLGAPVTLALQAGSRASQRRLLRVLHSRPLKVVVNPVTAWVLFGGTLIVLYFSPLYEASLRNESVHSAVHAHFVLVGALFMAYVVGLDPIPGALGYGARVLYLVVLLVFHTFVGVALLSSKTVIAADWYHGVVRSWGGSALSDQRTGAGVLWTAGELFGLVAIGVVVYQWMAADERAAARHDRRLDLEAAASQGDR
jgi:cytochrome c oxidase assembly factor CtaG